MPDNFELEGVEFKWEFEQDSDCCLPWEEHDGHGVIRQARTNYASKAPGEVILDSDNYTTWLYDVKASTALAKKDGWGLGDEEKAKLTERLGRAPTKKEIIAAAVANDMEFCRRYLNNDICWWSVSCWSEDEPDDVKSLGGILDEYGAPYLEECAKELAAQILHNRKAASAVLDLHMAGL